MKNTLSKIIFFLFFIITTTIFCANSYGEESKTIVFGTPVVKVESFPDSTNRTRNLCPYTSSNNSVTSPSRQKKNSLSYSLDESKSK